MLGISRDIEQLADLFDESAPSVRRMIAMLIEEAQGGGRKVGICGEVPSNDPEFAALLVRCGIDSISLSPDSVVRVVKTVAEADRA